MFFPCLFDKCRGKGTLVYNGKTLASICPKCKPKNSFIDMDLLGLHYKSLTIDKPNYIKMNDTKYLITSGICELGENKIQGVYTLMLEDMNTLGGFSFEVVTSYPSRTYFFITVVGSHVKVTIDDCSGCCNKKGQMNSLDQSKIEAMKKLKESSAEKIYARKITFQEDGSIIEEDLCKQSK